jgi:hypothetical protein
LRHMRLHSEHEPDPITSPNGNPSRRDGPAREYPPNIEADADAVPQIAGYATPYGAVRDATSAVSGHA